MSSVRTQHLTVLGTLCRRPSVLLLPLAPLALLVFFGATVASTLRSALTSRSSASSEAVTVEQIAAPAAGTTHVIRSARVSIRQVIGGAAALMGGVLIAASMAGGTYAFLNSQVKTSAVTVSSGSLTLTVQYSSGAASATATIPATVWTNMLPGDFVGQQFTIASTGSATSNITARLSTATAWDIRIAPGSCPATQLTSTPLTTMAGAQGQIAPGTNSVVCVQATLPASAPVSAEATTAPFSILIDATQVPSP